MTTRQTINRVGKSFAMTAGLIAASIVASDGYAGAGGVHIWFDDILNTTSGAAFSIPPLCRDTNGASNGNNGRSLVSNDQNGTCNGNNGTCDCR